MKPYQQTVFLSLPVKDLTKSVRFYQAIGFTKNTQFPDEDAACMVLSETFSIMLIPHSKWQQLTSRTIPDAKKSAQFGLNVSAENKSAVDTFIENGMKAGGLPDPNPIDDYEFMYGRGLEDPDGHIIEIKWMNLSAMP